MHVVFINCQQFLPVNFLYTEYFSKWAKANLSYPFTHLFDSPLWYILYFSFKSNKKVISWSKFDNWFIKKWLKFLSFQYLIVLIVWVLTQNILWVSNFLLKVTNKTLKFLVDKISFSVSYNELNDLLCFLEFYKIVLKWNIIKQNHHHFFILIFLFESIWSF